MSDPKESHLKKALMEGFNKNRNHPQAELWQSYAMSTNERGRLVVQTVENFIPSISKKRHLDIGCGYGGACIAFASESAESVGIDYDDRLLSFARENQRDHPDLRVEFRKMDVMDWEQMKTLGKFDIITCDNVIEHVPEPGRLVALCRLLTNPDGVIYITAPNAFSVGQIRKDCHYGLLGISLLDPDDGAAYVKHALEQPFYDVSWYYRYDALARLFEKNGLSFKLLNPYLVSAEDIDNLVKEYHQLLSGVMEPTGGSMMPPEIRQRIIYRLKHHIQMLETDILFEHEITEETGKAVYRNQMFREYHTELWYFILRPEPSSLPGEYAAIPSRFPSVENLSGRFLAKLLWTKILERLKRNAPAAVKRRT